MRDDTKRFYDEVWPHAATVLRTAQFLCRDDTEADDLTQEVMLKGFRHLDQLREGTDAKAWLITILRNTRIDRIRAAHAHQPDVSLEPLATDPPAPAADEPQFWQEPKALLEKFSDRQVIDALKKLPDPTAVVAGAAAVGHLLDPIGEAAHELPVVVRVAGREVEIAFV